jgi:hypothetical protein
MTAQYAEQFDWQNSDQAAQLADIVRPEPVLLQLDTVVEQAVDEAERVKRVKRRKPSCQ